MGVLDRFRTPRQATVTTIDTADEWRQRRATSPESPLQKDIRRFDERAPGFVGWYGDITGELISMVPIKPVKRHGLEWITPDTEPATPDALIVETIGQLLARYKSKGKDPEELVMAHGRAITMVGECMLGECRDWGRIVAQAPSLRETTEGVMWTGPDRIERPVLHLARSFTENYAQDRPWEAYSPMIRALPEVERYRDTVHAQIRPVRSRIITNGLVRFPSAHGDTKRLSEIRKAVSDLIEAANRDEVEREYMPRGRNASRHVPYPIMADEAPEHIDMGHDVDPATNWMEDKALAAFARAVRMPIKLFVEGPGSAKFSNEDHQMVWYLTRELQPVVRLVWRDIWNAYLRPELEMIRRFAAADGSKAFAPLASLDLERWRIRADTRDMIDQPDRADLLASGFAMGINSRAAAARASGGDLLELPADVDEYAHWEKVAGIAAASAASTAAGQAPAMATPLQVHAVARMKREAVASTPVLASLSVAPLPVAPLPKLAAPSSDEDGEAVAAALLAIDRRAYREISDWIAAATIDARTRLESLVLERYGMPAPWVKAKPDVKAIIRSLPPKSELRTTLREADDAAVVAAVAATIPWPELVNEAAAGVTTGEMDRALTRAHDGLNEIVDAPEPNRDRAHVAASSAILLWLMRQSSAKSALVAPTSSTSVVLMAGAGADVDAVTGRLVKGADGAPLISGQRWNGGSGYATGHVTMASLREEGYAVEWQWRHGYFGQPNDPFEPHVELHEQKRASADPQLWNDWFPGDHHFCRCAVVPILTPPSVKRVAA